MNAFWLQKLQRLQDILSHQRQRIQNVLGECRPNEAHYEGWAKILDGLQTVAVVAIFAGIYSSHRLALRDIHALIFILILLAICSYALRVGAKIAKKSDEARKKQIANPDVKSSDKTGDSK